MILTIREMRLLMQKVPQSYTWGLTSGGYDPIHRGHISCIEEAGRRCDNLIIVVNGDEFLRRKKGKAFMPLEDRCVVVDALRASRYVIPFSPSDPSDMTVNEAIEILRPNFFFKGGDRVDKKTIPEWGICEKIGTIVVTGVGDPKLWSSSDYLKDWTEFKAKGV